MKRLITISLLLGMVFSVSAQNNRITYNGQDLFLNGTNLAWIDFARDIGSEDVDFKHFGVVFKEIHDYGANSVRLWLHTNGVLTPAFDSDTVAGPGEGAIADLVQILDSAYKYDVGLVLCLWSFDMLHENLGEPYLSRNRKILEEENALNSYIEYALKPMVDSTKDHPGIIAWEVFNEPEGMIPDAFWGGWSHIGHVTRQDVQRVVNRVAGAIHRINPDLQVTNGTHNLHSLSDRGDHNFYSDSALFNAGGDADGYLDFYEVHYYSDFPLNPFEYHYEYWNLDKPLLIGEMYPGCEDCGAFSNYETLIDSGYAGAMGWMWLSTHGEDIKEEVQYLFLNRTADVDIDNMLGDTPALYFSGPAYGSVLESGSDIAFSAKAEDTDGTVTQVEFILDNEVGEDSVLNTDMVVPYEFTWLAPEDGTYRVYARATDNDGYVKQSSKIAFTVGDPPIFRYEAEDALISGDANIQDDTEASNGQYINFLSGCSLEWTIPNCPAANSYDMIIGYGVPYGEKNNYIVINNDTDNQIDWHFDGPTEEWLRDTISVDLVEGRNTITIRDFWGWMQFDFIEFPFPRPPLANQISMSTVSGNAFINTPEGTLQIQATIEPAEASVYPVEWSVDNDAFASIDEAGLLTAKGNGTVKVTAAATDDSGVTGNIDISISNQITGIDQISARPMLYPNPVTEYLFIDSGADQFSKVEITDIEGRTLIALSVAGQSLIQIPISLPDGFYIVKLSKEQQHSQHKIIVKKN